MAILYKAHIVLHAHFERRLVAMKSRRSTVTRANQCNYRSTGCTIARATKPDGSLHRYCTAHRRHEALMMRRLRQHQELLESIADTFHRRQQDPTLDEETRRAPRPRFVLLGNQQSLILGIVLSQRNSTPTEIPSPTE